MTVQETPYPVVSRMVDIFGDWVARNPQAFRYILHR